MSTSIYPSKNDYSEKLMKLMVKKHMITGKKYLCKTTEKNHHAYKGSGTEWKKMLEEHGREQVRTIVIFTSYSKSLFREVAERMSERLDVVASDDWANLIIENGVGGGMPGRIKSPEECEKIRQSKLGKKRGPLSAQWRENISKGNIGKKMPLRGPMSEEQKKAIGEANKGKEKDATWRENLANSLRGKPHTQERIDKMTRNRRTADSNREAAKSIEFVDTLRSAFKR
jgi:hypothetical protein